MKTKEKKRILIPVGYIKQEEEKHEQSDFDGTFNTGSTGEIHTGAGSDGDCKIYSLRSIEGEENRKVSKSDFPFLCCFWEKCGICGKVCASGNEGLC